MHQTQAAERQLGMLLRRMRVYQRAPYEFAASRIQNDAEFERCLDLATALNAQGNRAEATNQLLEIVRRDRKWNEDGARKQLVQLFEAWGPGDEATVEGRKRLSTILFL